MSGPPATATPSPTEKAGSGPRDGTWIVPSTHRISRATWMIANRPKPRV